MNLNPHLFLPSSSVYPSTSALHAYAQDERKMEAFSTPFVLSVGMKCRSRRIERCALEFKLMRSLAESKAKQSSNNLVRLPFNLAYQPTGGVILNLFQDLCGAFNEMLKQVQHDSEGTDRQNKIVNVLDLGRLYERAFRTRNTRKSFSFFESILNRLSHFNFFLDCFALLSAGLAMTIPRVLGRTKRRGDI